MGYSPWGHKIVRHDLATQQQQQTDSRFSVDQANVSASQIWFADHQLVTSDLDNESFVPS